jgi:hypothetical protein
MQLARTIGWLFLFCIFTGSLPVNKASAEEKESKIIYKADIIGPDGKPTEKAFNVSEGDLNELTTLLQRG